MRRTTSFNSPYSPPNSVLKKWRTRQTWHVRWIWEFHTKLCWKNRSEYSPVLKYVDCRQVLIKYIHWGHWKGSKPVPHYSLTPHCWWNCPVLVLCCKIKAYRHIRQSTPPTGIIWKPANKNITAMRQSVLECAVSTYVSLYYMVFFGDVIWRKHIPHITRFTL